MKRFLLAALLFLALTLPGVALDLGDKALPLSVDKWVTGEPVDPTVVDGESFYLVEVWSVTCPPCVKSIPIMNDIQKRYADQGFKIVSFTTDSEEEVRPFLEQHPMEYSSFLDKECESVINYMALDNRTTVPHAFLFDKSGILVWEGNPLDNLEKRVQQVLSGELSGEIAVKVKEARDQLQEAFNAQNISGMLSALETLEGLEPANSQYFQIHYRLLTELGMGDPFEVEELLDRWYTGSQTDAESLIVLSMVSLDQGQPTIRNPELALRAAKKAYSIDSDLKAQAGLNLAETYKGIGRIDLALKTLDELPSLTTDPEDAEMIAAVRTYYGKLEKLGENPDAVTVE
ncbi:MAG: redoxin domain-containing protein [Planctomycetes bacterium]|nr:redoxin domain-containing protein [Planctomycetota bacterium]